MASTRSGFALATIAILIALPVAISEATLSTTIFHLESIPSTLNHSLDNHSIRARDRLRYSWMLQQSNGRGNGIVDFPLKGSADPSTFGYYFTKVKLGTNMREFNVLIDTGSDIPWVVCESCTTCPQTSEYRVKHNLFDSSSSSTARVFHCTDPICDSKITPTTCSVENQCEYNLLYGDKSTISGHLVSDRLSFDMITGQSEITNHSSATLVFGCSDKQTGNLGNPNITFDGIFGFGQGLLSIPSQLFAQGLAPRVFSHCLKGDSIGGGIMVLGEILEPSIVYTPLAPSRSHYNIYLQSIAVNGQLLSIDKAVFTPRHGRETFIDSGTTLAYLVEHAFYPLINLINMMVTPFATPIIDGDFQCYLIPQRFSESEIFPMVSLNFVGGASIMLKPKEYLLHLSSTEEGSRQCLGFMKAPDSNTILGELVLKDKIVVYDLARRRLGWAPYDCSMPLNVSATQEEVAGRGGSGSSFFLSLKFIAIISTSFLLLVFFCCLALYYRRS